MLPIDREQACRRIAAAMASGRRYRTHQMSPSLSYGRHRGPAGHRLRQAAVLIGLMDGPGNSMSIPLTLRPGRLKHHGGQICFPGGGIEDGESIEAAAIREFEEELGHRPDVIEFLGCLPPISVYASAHWVHPVVVRISDPRASETETIGSPQDWKPDPNEVEEVIVVSLDSLVQHGPPKSHLIRRPVSRLNRSVANASEESASGESRSGAFSAVDRAAGDSRKSVAEVCFRAPAFEIDGHRIWGATAILLDELAQMLR